MALEKARVHYHKLVLLVSDDRFLRRRVLEALATAKGTRPLDLNLDLSSLLLPLAQRERVREVEGLVAGLARDAGSDLLLLDGTEVLFERSLKHDPLRLLKNLSRDRAVVAAWSGTFQEGFLVYGVPEHPEYRREAADGVQVVTLRNHREGQS